MKFVVGKLENILGKGENAGYQNFQLFPKCSQKPASKVKVKYEGPNILKNLTCKQTIFLLLLNFVSYKAHILYEGTSHEYTSTGTKVTFIWQGQGQI